MATLYLNFHKQDFMTFSAIYPLLVPTCNAEEAIKTPGWWSTQRTPRAIGRWSDDEELVEYHRFGDDDGVEPLVLVRDFHDLKEPYVEISEEFRLFHNLYFDQGNNTYVKLDGAGQETTVVDIQSHRVRFRIREVRQYLAIREMHLLVQFDIHERSRYSLAQLSLEKGETANHDELSNWRHHLTELDRADHIAFARFIGKRLVPPVNKRYSGFPGFSQETKRYVDFLIGQDNQGRDIRATCDPTSLPRYTTDEPEFFTPVCFRKSVLERYYSQPSKFKVSDGFLSCGNLWMLPIDDDHDDRVCVWLGDLGEKLPYGEQQHWQAHNFLPPDTRVSGTFFDRQFAAKFAESSRPEHQFRDLYRQLSETCETKLGWQILQPLHNNDAHRLASVRIPALGEQPAFDDQVQHLATILVDSLHKRRIQDLVPEDERPHREASIDLLEAMFCSRDINHFQEHIDLLRTVQSLRSAGTAHRKGHNYEKLVRQLNLTNRGHASVVADLIRRANQFLRFLITVVETRQLTP